MKLVMFIMELVISGCNDVYMDLVMYFLFDVYGTCDVGMGSCLIPLWCLRNLWPQGCIDVYGTCLFSFWCIWNLWCRNGKLFRSLVMFMELVYFLFDVYGTCDVGMGTGDRLIPLWCNDVYGTLLFSVWCILNLWCRNGSCLIPLWCLWNLWLLGCNKLWKKGVVCIAGNCVYSRNFRKQRKKEKEKPIAAFLKMRL